MISWNNGGLVMDFIEGFLTAHEEVLLHVLVHRFIDESIGSLSLDEVLRKVNREQVDQLIRGRSKFF
jgi:hypothetical protein